MSTSPTHFTVEFHFTDKSPVVREIYNRLMNALRKFGPVTEEPRKLPSISCMAVRWQVCPRAKMLSG